MRSHDEANKILLKIEELIKPLNKGSKIWNDHLAKYLDEYMACVEDIVRDDTRGVMAVSFVQAGRMIENSSKVYGSNVDYLWQFITEVMEVLRMNMCSKNNAKRSEASAEMADSSEHHEERPQKRRKEAVFKDFEEIVINVIDPDMKTAERNEVIKPLPLQHIMTKPAWNGYKSSHKIVDVDDDTVVPSDYSVMLQTSSDGKLQVNMLKEVINECSEVTTMQQSSSELIHFLELLIKELSHGDRSHGSSDDPSLGNTVSESTTSENVCTDLPEHPAVLSLPVTPPTSPEPISGSASDTGTPERIKRSLSEAGSEKEVCAAAYCARRSGEKEQLVTGPFDLSEPVALDDSIHEKPLKRRQMFSLPCDLGTFKSDGKKHKSGHKVEMELIVKYHGTEVLRTYLKEALFPLCADFEQFYLGHLTKELMLLDHPKVFGTYRDQEDFHHHLSKEYDEDFFGFEDYEGVLGEDEEEEEFLGWPHEEEDVCSQNGDATCDSSVAVPLPVAVSCGSESTVPSHAQSTPETVHEGTEADIARRVAEWEHYIRPKLKVARDRGHFDIHKVGTEILKSFPQSPSRVMLQFEQFAADKPTADVPRYFLASLQLANSYNIDISQSSPGDLHMDCMHMTVLSPVRHHQVLQDYEAPSQGAKHKHVSKVIESSDNNGDRSWSRSVCKKKHQHVLQDSERNRGGGDSLLSRSMSKKKHKHVSQVAVSNSDNGDISSSRSMSKKKHKHVSQVAVSNSDNGDISSSRSVCKKKYKCVSQDSSSNSDDGDSSSSRSVCKKKRKHILQDPSSSTDDGDSSLIRNVSKGKRKHVSRLAASSSDTDGDSSSSRSVSKQKRNKR